MREERQISTHLEVKSLPPPLKDCGLSRKAPLALPSFAVLLSFRDVFARCTREYAYVLPGKVLDYEKRFLDYKKQTARIAAENAATAKKHLRADTTASPLEKATVELEILRGQVAFIASQNLAGSVEQALRGTQLEKAKQGLPPEAAAELERHVQQLGAGWRLWKALRQALLESAEGLVHLSKEGLEAMRNADEAGKGGLPEGGERRRAAFLLAQASFAEVDAAAGAARVDVAVIESQQTAERLALVLLPPTNAL